MSEDKKVNALKEVVRKVTKKKPSLQDLVKEWRKCRSPRKRATLLREIRKAKKSFKTSDRRYR